MKINVIPLVFIILKKRMKKNGLLKFIVIGVFRQQIIINYKVVLRCWI